MEISIITGTAHGRVGSALSVSTPRAHRVPVTGTVQGTGLSFDGRVAPSFGRVVRDDVTPRLSSVVPSFGRSPV